MNTRLTRVGFSAGRYSTISRTPGCDFIEADQTTFSTAWTGWRCDFAGPGPIWIQFGIRLVRDLGRFKEGADLCQFDLSAAIGEEAEVADAHEALGEDMQQKPPDQFLARQAHELMPVMVSIVSVTQFDLLVLDADDAPIMERNFAAITAEIINDPLRSLQIGFGVNHPVCLHEMIKYGVNFAGPGDAVEFTSVGGFAQGADHIPAKVARQGLDREQVVALGSVPVALISQGAPGYQTVQMDVPAKGLSPGV